MSLDSRGDSGIGKSETDLDLSNQSAVADDRVDILWDNYSLGEPAKSWHPLFVGLGLSIMISIVPVLSFFWVQLAVYLKITTHKTFDRLGNNAEDLKFL